MPNRASDPRLIVGAALMVLTALPVSAQGVPIVDPKSLILHALEIEQQTTLTGAREMEADRKARLAALQADQLDALDATMAALSGATPWIADLDALDGAEAGVLYAVAEDSPHAARLFGDAAPSVEEMIIATARRYSGHPGLARAGLTPVEFRIWFQSLVKQESNFSIGARSPVGAFGLTQVMPETAKGLGIYPEYYDDPLLQLDGGARYFLTQLEAFGAVPLALAAYNAGPGNVAKYGGIPPFKETEAYVVRITGYFNSYARRIGGIDQMGTLDPRDVAIAAASTVSDAGLHYGMEASAEIETALRRVRAIIEKIPTTTSVKEAMDLNTQARAEATRIAWKIARIKAARARVDAARAALWLQAYARDEGFLNVNGGLQ